MASAAGEKAPGAFKTIGELSRELGVAQHILRYWETRFPELRPLQRAGNRRYYRPADVELVRRIHQLLTAEGYTVRGVQKLLREKADVVESNPMPGVMAMAEAPQQLSEAGPSVDLDRLRALRNRLADALND
jgi:DNA-binding transcriptional MerR regulator